MISISSFMMAHVSDSDDIVAKLLTESFSRLSYNDKLEWQRISCMTRHASASSKRTGGWTLCLSDLTIKGRPR